MTNDMLNANIDNFKIAPDNFLSRTSDLRYLIRLLFIMGGI